jgi:hypothetical protein
VEAEDGVRAILSALPTALRTRVALSLNAELLRHVAFLRELGPDCLSLLVAELHPFRVSAGYWVSTKGALGRDMCFVADGLVEVLGHKNKQLGVLQRGAYFGELAMLADTPPKHSASVRALASIAQGDVHACRLFAPLPAATLRSTPPAAQGQRVARRVLWMPPRRPVERRGSGTCCSGRQAERNARPSQGAACLCPSQRHISHRVSFGTCSVYASRRQTHSTGSIAVAP